MNWIKTYYINPKFTSQTCSKCKEINKCKNKKYKCAYCGLQIHRDENASYNIANKGKVLIKNNNTLAYTKSTCGAQALA